MSYISATAEIMYAPLDRRFAIAPDTVHHQLMKTAGHPERSPRRRAESRDLHLGLASDLQLGRIMPMKRKLSIVAMVLALAGFLFVFIAPEIPTPNVVIKSPQVQVSIVAVTLAPVARAAHSATSLVFANHTKALPRTASLIDITCVRLC